MLKSIIYMSGKLSASLLFPHLKLGDCLSMKGVTIVECGHCVHRKYVNSVLLISDIWTSQIEHIERKEVEWVKRRHYIKKEYFSFLYFSFNWSCECSYILRSLFERVIRKKLIVLSKKFNRMFLMVVIWIKQL